jgi:hypothetical protein
MKKQKIFRGFFGSTAGFCLLLLAGCVDNPLRPATPAATPAAPMAEVPPAVRPTVAMPAVQRSGYLCCNLHHDGDRWSDANYSQLSFIPVGTPVTVRTRGDQVLLEAGGKVLRLEMDGRRLNAWLEKWVPAEDPSTRMASWPAVVRGAVGRGQLMKGMSREQVIAAAGYPQGNDTLHTDKANWRYWWSGYVPYYVHWGHDSVARVEAPSEILGQVLHKGK